MRIIDEIMPKIRAEARLDKDNKTLWVKADTLDGYDRIIIEDGSVWCRIFYEDCGECAHNKAEQTEPSNSEKPNNCEHITEDGVTCAKYPACDDCLDNPLNKVKGSKRLLKGKDEPTGYNLSPVDKDINVRSKTEPQTCSVNGRPYTDCCNCEYFKCTADEPQMERSSE